MRRWLLREVGKFLAQTLDDCFVGKPEERVDFLFERECRNERMIRIVFCAQIIEQLLRFCVRWFAVERKSKVVRDVVVTWVNQCRVGQSLELVRERFVEFIGMTTTTTVACAGIEQCVAGKKCRYIGL